MFKQVGTVEVLRHRIYPLDAGARDDLRTTVCVAAGSYPVLSDGISFVMMFTGLVNGNSIRRGDGLFFISGSDTPLPGLEVTFPGPVKGPDEWADLTSDPVCLDDHPDQRLRVKIWEEVTS
jgi:hypothetical protein